MDSTTKSLSRFRFDVADVTPATKKLPTVTLQHAIERTTRLKTLVCPKAGESVVQESDFHPLIAAAAIAFQDHYPLVLSPDMIWITILQGVAQHIQNHSETLRSRLVQHETKIELVLDTNLTSLPQTEAEMLFVAREFANMIARHAPADKQFLFNAEFSTTTDSDRIACSVALMDAFEPYFEYIMMIICGIPSVVLEGTSDDWKLLKQKVETLHASDLELSWWTKHLLPLCEHFIRAVEGDVDLSHWRNLCKIIERYGVNDLNGWILKFIPYIKRDRNGPLIHKNPVLELTNYAEPSGKREDPHGQITGCTSNMLPPGLSKTPVTCHNKQSGQSTKITFVAGLVGVVQSSEDLSLRSMSGWAIGEGAEIDKWISKLRLDHEVAPPKKTDANGLWEIATRVFDGYLPVDMVRFYKETGGAVIKLKQGGTLRLLPISEVKMIGEGFRGNVRLKELWESNKLSIKAYTEQTKFNNNYAELCCIATLDNGMSYVFGHDPEVQFDGRKFNSRGEIFLWTGERTPEAFTPIAHTFTEWIESLLKS